MKTQFFLFGEDCVSGMQRIPDGAVNLIVTSPPYNLGVDYGQDTTTKPKSITWSGQWPGRRSAPTLDENGSLFLNLGGSPSNPLLPHEVVIELRKLFVLQNTIHWIKSITVTTPKGGEISAGHFKPINSKRFLNNCHEYIFHLTKTGKKPIDRLGVGVAYTDKSNIARWGHTNHQDKRCRGTTGIFHTRPFRTGIRSARTRPRSRLNCLPCASGYTEGVRTSSCSIPFLALAIPRWRLRNVASRRLWGLKSTGISKSGAGKVGYDDSGNDRNVPITRRFGLRVIMYIIPSIYASFCEQECSPRRRR